MSNSNKDAAEKAMDTIADAAPIVTFIIACLAFACVLLFKTDYYTQVFANRWNWYGALGVGFIAALAAEGSRAILLVLTFRDFRSSNNIGGFLGLILSFALVGYEIFSAGPISSLWAGTMAGGISAVIRDAMVFLITLSAGLELRLALSSRVATATKSSKSSNATQRSRNVASNVASNATLHNPVASNATQQPATQRNSIGFQLQQKQQGSAALQVQLDKAKGNMRAYKSKLEKAKSDPSMNLETQQKGFDRWSARVADIEQQLKSR